MAGPDNLDVVMAAQLNNVIGDVPQSIFRNRSTRLEGNLMLSI
jgi:hypothetical protein